MTAAETPSARLEALGLRLPAPWGSAASGDRSASPVNLGPGVRVYAEFVRVSERRVLVSGHLPIDDDGKVCGPFGKVGDAVDAEAAKAAAHRVMLGMFSSLVRELGSLERIDHWLHLYGMVNGAPGFNDFPGVINVASKLVYDVFGPEAGRHARIAIGVGGLPFDAPVEIGAELVLKA